MSSYVKMSTLEKAIEKQIKLWEKSKTSGEEEGVEKIKPFITISREYGCNAVSVSEVIAKKLNEYEKIDEWHIYDKELLDKIVEDQKISRLIIENIDTKKRNEMKELIKSMVSDYPPDVAVYKKLVETVRSLAFHGRAILIGRAGAVITRGMKKGLHIRLIAPEPYRIHRVMETHGIGDMKKAKELVKGKDQQRHDFLIQYIKFDVYNPESYDLTINVANFDNDIIADIVTCALSAKGYI